MSLLEDRCTTSLTTSTVVGDNVDKNQEEALCNQFAAMPSPSRRKSLDKCSDDNTPALHDMIASALIGLEKDWTGQLLLRCLPMTSQDVKDADASGEPLDDINICDYLSGKKKEQHYVRLNFSPSEFPPPLWYALLVLLEEWGKSSLVRSIMHLIKSPSPRREQMSTSVKLTSSMMERGVSDQMEDHSHEKLLAKMYPREVVGFPLQ